ncbi:MAG: hypothetical protein IT373_13185 [Polyangiaceae bacterium]|nr:hypothetical protein [Polyangiaceae bacterium]
MSPSSRKTLEVDPGWLERGSELPADDGRASEAARGRTSQAPASRRTLEVDPAWLERDTLPCDPAGTAPSPKRPPPLPRQERPPARRAPPPLPEEPARARSGGTRPGRRAVLPPEPEPSGDRARGPRRGGRES